MVAKGTLVVAAVLSALPCLASFELALIYDTATDGIVRYDPMTNRSLGSFGSERLGFYAFPSLCLDPSRPGELAVLNADGGIRWFNYSTGEYTRGVNLATLYYSNTQMQLQMLPNGNALVTGYVSGGAQTRVYSGTTGALLTTLSNLTGYEPLQSGLAGDGNYYSLVRRANASDYTFYIFKYSAAGSYLGYTSAGDGTADLWYSMRVRDNLLYMVGKSAGDVAKGTIASGSVTLTGLWGSYFTSLGCDNIMFGHSGAVHFTQHAVDGSSYINRWYTIDPVNGYYSPTQTMPFTSRLGSVALVVAPEPATLLALGVGTGAVCARRRWRGKRPAR